MADDTDVIGTVSKTTKFNIDPYTVPNKKVAVEPFPPVPRAEVKNGLLQPMNQAALTPLKVIFTGAMCVAGSVVYVRTKVAQTTTYAKEVFEVGGKKFILIPEDDVILIEAIPPYHHPHVTWASDGQ